MKDVVTLTQGLYAVAKVRIVTLFLSFCAHGRPIACQFCTHVQETAQLESEAFVQRQKVALASEIKTVLDSWVRFEQQQKENEQAQLVKTVVDNVLKNLNEEKTQKEVLAWAVSEVERKSFPLSISRWWCPATDAHFRQLLELVKSKAI
jgi:F-type H+-transporting ATPase subunit b